MRKRILWSDKKCSALSGKLKTLLIHPLVKNLPKVNHGLAASCYGGDSQRQGQGVSRSELRERWTHPDTERSLMKTCSSARNLRLELRFTFMTMTQCQNNAEVASCQFSDCLWLVQPKPRLEHLCRDLKMAVHRWFPSNLTWLERSAIKNEEKTAPIQMSNAWRHTQEDLQL